MKSLLCHSSIGRRLIAAACLISTIATSTELRAASAQVLGWNNLGMHCMDSDYSVFSILPPYNTIEAQLVVGGKLVTNGSGYTLTYQAVADPSGSFNSTAMNKGNYYQFATALYGPHLAPEQGLAGWNMPGLSNTPQGMTFETSNVLSVVNWWRAEGIPISPYDDVGRKNPYPMMRLVARNGSGQVIATNDIVLPVSDEMDCRACHASGTPNGARPAAGWVWSDNQERDFRLNILRMHDESQFALTPDLYKAALAARGFNPLGLYRGVVADGKPVLCAICHASEALGLPSFGTIPPLTASMHAFHAYVMDTDLPVTLGNSANRAACYRCHPGSTTRCLRGAMGSAVASDGSLSMQCQSCHGNMADVGSLNRIGWLQEPNCQACHSGTALTNSGLIRYTSAFTVNGDLRVPADKTFATTPNAPAPGLSLYRWSSGHGGLQCSACHGCTHAEFPATHTNDNVRNMQIQGHAGVMVECTSCHSTRPSTVAGGPHGMHPADSTWVSGHGDLFETGGAVKSQCTACHGLDYKGTVLSRAQTTRTFNTSNYGTKNYWRGKFVSCFDCHNGPNSSNPSANSPAVVSNISSNTVCGAPVSMPITATDSNANALTFRVISQPQNGTVGISNSAAVYYPGAGFVGTDTFTFAAWDGTSDSNLGTGTVAVAQGPFGLSVKPLVPTSQATGWPVPFGAAATASNITAPILFSWTFGDGSALVNTQFTKHTYTNTGSYSWKLVASVSSGASTVSVTNTGFITVTAPISLSAIPISTAARKLRWPAPSGDVLLEQTLSLNVGHIWQPVTNGIEMGLGFWSVTLSNDVPYRFFRLRKL